jgi:hypothetical protein
VQAARLYPSEADAVLGASAQAAGEEDEGDYDPFFDPSEYTPVDEFYEGDSGDEDCNALKPEYLNETKDSDPRKTRKTR